MGLPIDGDSGLGHRGINTQRGTKMAKKDEKKAESTGVELVATPKAVTGVTTTLAEVEALAVVAKAKLDGLADLLDDTELSAPIKEKVQALMELANPNKPGMEEINTTWTLPRVSIAQPTTQSAAKPESAKAGDMFTSSGTLLERPFGLIPLWFHEENIMFKTGEKAPECSSMDGKVGSAYGRCNNCPHLPFGKQNGGRGEQKKTECQSQIVVTALSADLTQVYSVQFAKTSRSAGNALISLAKSHPFPWKQSYLLSTEKKVGDLGTYYIYKIEPTGKDNSAEAAKVAKALSELFGANRKVALGDRDLRIGGAANAAAASEIPGFDAAKLAAGLNLSSQGEELDLGDASPAASVRSTSKPM